MVGRNNILPSSLEPNMTIIGLRYMFVGSVNLKNTVA